MPLFNRFWGSCLAPLLAACAFLLVLANVAVPRSESAEFNAKTSHMKEPLSWLAFGDLRGYIEPCGCDPATDLGGIKRMGTLILRERLLHKNLLLFSLGNNLSDNPAEAAIKNPFLIEAHRDMKVTAYLVNERELHNLKYLDHKMAPKLNLLLSNAKTKPLKTIHEVIDAPQAVIYGYVWNADQRSQLKKVDEPLLKSWRDAMSQHPKKSKVLLFSGPDQDLDVFMKSKLFDVIVSSNNAPQNKVVGQDERLDQDRLKRGEDIWMVPLGGQGFIRGGKLRFQVAPSIKQILVRDKFPQDCKPGPGLSVIDSQTRCRPIKGGLAFPQATIVTWLTPADFESDAFSDLMDRYNKATKAAFLARKDQRLQDLQHSPFAGAAACKSCHSQAFEVWSKSKHAQAIGTLIKKGKEFDGECIACHVVGADAKGGFVSVADSPHLANVQCENCHGPRRDHIKNITSGTYKPGVKTSVQNVCVTCHNATHSPSFDSKSYWDKIKHL